MIPEHNVFTLKTELTCTKWQQNRNNYLPDYYISIDQLSPNQMIGFVFKSFLHRTPENIYLKSFENVRFYLLLLTPFDLQELQIPLKNNHFTLHSSISFKQSIIWSLFLTLEVLVLYLYYGYSAAFYYSHICRGRCRNQSISSKNVGLLKDCFIKSPQSGVTMFWVRFRSRVSGRRCRNDFCFSRQNHLSSILDIWDKESIGQGKCTGWPLGDLDPRSRLWHW